MINHPSKLSVVGAFLAVYLIWGSTYLAALICLQSMPPLVISTFRFLMAGIVLILIGWSRQEKFPSRKAIVVNGFGGMLVLGCGTGSVIWAEQYITSGATAILVSTLPIWFLALDKYQWRQYVKSVKLMIGVALGFLGIILLKSTNIGSATAIADQWQLTSVVVLLSGCFLYVLGSLYLRYKIVDGGSSYKVAIQLLTASLMSSLVAYMDGEWSTFTLINVSTQAWWSLVYLIFMGSIVAYSCYIWLLSVKPPAVVGTYAYVNPVIAVILGFFFADEHFSSLQIAALGIILLGVFLINSFKSTTISPVTNPAK